MTRKNKREDVLASLDAALAGKAPSPLAGGKKEVLAEQAAPTVATPANSGSPTVAMDLTSLAATTAGPDETTTQVKVPTPKPVLAALPKPVAAPKAEEKPATPTLVSQPIAPPASVPQAEQKAPEAEKTDKRAVVVKMVEEALAKKLQPLMDEIESLRTQLGNVTKMLMGNLGMENMPGVLEAIEQNGGVLENLDAADTKAKEAGTAAEAAKAKTDGLEGRFGELDGRVVSLDKEVGTLDALAKEARSVAGTAQAKADELEGRFGELDSRVTSLDSEVGTLTGKTDSLTTEVGTLNGQIESLNTQVGAASDAGAAAQLSADTVSGNVSALESDFADLKTLILGGIPEEMVDKLLAIVGENGGLYVQVDSFQDKVSEVDSKATQMDGSIAEVDKKVGALDKKVGAMGTSVGDLSSDVGGLRSKLETVEDLAKRANGKADSAVDLSGDVTRLSGDVLAFDRKFETLEKRVQSEGQDHVNVLQHELAGLLLGENPKTTDIQEFIKVNSPDRVKAALAGMNRSPKLVRNLTIDMTKVRETNGVTSEQLDNPGDDVVAQKAAAYVTEKVAQVSTRVEYILTNWEKI